MAAETEELTWQARLGARTIARQIEMGERRREMLSARRPVHLDMEPVEQMPDPDSGRRVLAPDPALVLIGRYLRRGRRYAEMTQQQLAETAGVSQSMVSRLERGVAPAAKVESLANVTTALARLFPFGFCPHDHHCGWQPVKHQDWTITDASKFIEYLLKTAGET